MPDTCCEDELIAWLIDHENPPHTVVHHYDEVTEDVIMHPYNGIPWVNQRQYLEDEIMHDQPENMINDMYSDLLEGQGYDQLNPSEPWNEPDISDAELAELNAAIEAFRADPSNQPYLLNPSNQPYPLIPPLLPNQPYPPLPPLLPNQPYLLNQPNQPDLPNPPDLPNQPNQPNQPDLPNPPDLPDQPNQADLADLDNVELVVERLNDYLENDGGILRRLYDDTQIPQNELERRVLIGRPPLPTLPNQPKRLFPMDFPVRIDRIQVSNQRTIQDEKTRIAHISALPIFRALAGYRIRINDEPGQAVYLQLHVYEAMRFLRAESRSLPIIYNPAPIVRNNAFQRLLEPLTLTNNFLFNPPHLTANFPRAYRAFKNASPETLQRFFAQYTRLTGTFLERSRALYNHFRLVPELREELPGHAINYRSGLMAANTPLKMALILYEIYFTTGHYDFRNQQIPMFWGSPFQVNEITAENFRLDISENQISRIYRANRVLWGYEPPLFSAQGYNDVMQKCDQCFEDWSCTMTT
ncbi:hypothetical protein SNEBB_010532, partial [Seison nebaliae]